MSGGIMRDMATVEVSADNRRTDLVPTVFLTSLVDKINHHVRLADPFTPGLMVEVDIEYRDSSPMSFDFCIQTTFAAQSPVAFGKRDILVKENRETGKESVSIMQRKTSGAKVVGTGHRIGKTKGLLEKVNLIVISGPTGIGIDLLKRHHVSIRIAQQGSDFLEVFQNVTILTQPLMQPDSSSVGHIECDHFDSHLAEIR